MNELGLSIVSLSSSTLHQESCATLCVPGGLFIVKTRKKPYNYYKGGHIQYKILQTVSVGLL